MKRILLAFGFSALFLNSAAVWAAECRPIIEKPWVRAAPPTAKVLAGYLIVRNPCKAAIEITDVESKDFAMPMIHRTTTTKDGRSQMRDAGVLKINPGERLVFAPGGLHLMLMRPLRTIKEGDKIGARLVLKNGERVYAEFPVLRETP
jgi:periplasmic copper chaperone A